MKEIFKDVLSINGVQGVVLISNDAKVIYDSLEENPAGKKQTFTNWKKLLGVLGNAREADFVMENGRFYFRRTDSGCLMISMQSFASIAMVKLNCDILIPQLKKGKEQKGLKGFFNR